MIGADEALRRGREHLGRRQQIVDVGREVGVGEVAFALTETGEVETRVPIPASARASQMW